MKKQLVSRSTFEKKIWDSTYDALKLLVEGSYYTQLTFGEFSIDPDSLSTLKEFCTIRMTTSRRSGHSWAISRLAMELFDDVIFLSANRGMSENLHSIIRKLQTDSDQFTKITETMIQTRSGQYFFDTFANNSFSDRFRGVKTDAVIIDGAFSLTKNKLDLIYDTLGPCMSGNPQKFFIFVS